MQFICLYILNQRFLKYLAHGALLNYNNYCDSLVIFDYYFYSNLEKEKNFEKMYFNYSSRICKHLYRNSCLFYQYKYIFIFRYK